MGQKVNPVGFRLGVNRGWDSGKSCIQIKRKIEGSP